MRKAPNRQFSREFKIQLCTQIRAGAIGRREAQRAHRLSGGLIQVWLTRYDRGELCSIEQASARLTEEYERRIAELERKVGQLTMEADHLRTALAKATAGNDNAPGDKGHMAAS